MMCHSTNICDRDPLSTYTRTQINLFSCQFTEVRDLFRKWREDNERRSDDVIQLWKSVLESKMHKLGNERHLVLEQVIIAAFDANRIEVAEACIQILSTEFPGSLRVHKFKAMRLEALELYDEAEEALDTIIQLDETNAAPRKRKIAILKARGQIADAIRELCSYLKQFMSDQEAWHELCNLYLIECDYAKAAFCMEELLLHNPHSHLIHQRLAEIRYTMVRVRVGCEAAMIKYSCFFFTFLSFQGGIDNIETAKTYFAQALKLNQNNLRALYGLYLVRIDVDSCIE